MAEKWKLLKKNMVNHDWKKVRDDVKSVDAKLKELCANYKGFEKDAVKVFNKICSLYSKPL